MAEVSREEEEEGRRLVWEDISVQLRNSADHSQTRRLLNGLSGYAKPGRILAFMGPSGSGKTTLLDSLAEAAKYGLKNWAWIVFWALSVPSDIVFMLQLPFQLSPRQNSIRRTPSALPFLL